MYDVIIIGGGVTGCATAREMARYCRPDKTPLQICVLEKDEDICSGTSKANSGIVHSGIDAHFGSKKAELNVEGSRRMEALSKELDFPYRRNGSMIVAFGEEDRIKLEELCENGRKNGLTDVRVIDGAQARSLEPHLSAKVSAAAIAPSGGIVCPFGLTIAMAENAAENGVEFCLNTEVIEVLKTQEGFKVRAAYNPDWKTEKEERTIEGRYLVNAAGLYSGVIHNMLSEKKYTVQARKGEYCLLDRSEGAFIKHTIFQLPTKYGKGVLVTPTVHGNLMIGPTAYDTDDKEAVQTTRAGLDEVLKKAGLSVDRLPTRKVITSFSGLRAHTEADDFIIGEAEDVEGLFDAVGIESPGLTAAPAVGARLAAMVAAKCGAAERVDFQPVRKGIPNPSAMSVSDWNKLIQEEPAYGNIICRCEMISEGEILAAVHRPLGAKSLDAVKRRTRAGMGRCQSGFCSPKVLEILAREWGRDWTEITKKGGASGILTAKTRA